MLLTTYVPTRELKRYALQVFAASLFLLAMLAKEVALAALPVIAALPVARLALGGDRLTWGAARRVLLQTLVVFIVPALLAIAARLVVLRGIGGYFESAGALGDISPEAYGQVFASFVGFLLWPVPGLESFALLFGVVLGAGMALSLPHWKRGEIVAFGIGVLWMLCFCGFYMALKLLGASAWYMYLPLVGWGLVLGAIAQACVPRLASAYRTRSFSSPTMELGTPVLFGCTAILVVATVWWSPIFTGYTSWKDGGQVVEHFVEGASDCFGRAPANSVLVADGVPTGVSYIDRANRLAGVTLLDDYSVQAMGELLAPSQQLTVHQNSGALVRQASPEARVECSPGADGWHLNTSGLR
jgi:hypothetical protein